MLAYRVDVENHDGAVVAQFDRFTSCNLSLRWNACGSHQFIAPADERTSTILDDYHIRVWLRDDDNGIAWTEVYTGFHKTWVRALAETGARTFTSYGPALEELLKKENILWYSGSDEAAKSGTTSEVMWDYAYENVGPDALASGGRDLDGVVAGLSFAARHAVGPAWEGSRSRQNLLDVLVELVQHSQLAGDPVDFRITRDGGYGWQFAAGKLAVDRTTRGLNHTTGENSAGNAPVVFSDGLGNVKSYSRSLSRYDEANTIVALGQGEGASRLVVVVQDTTAVNVSPVARRTTTISTNETTTAALEAAARAKLEEMRAVENYSFAPLKTSPVLFRDFALGDYVTAMEAGDEFHIQVTGVNITVNNESGESIGLEYRRVDLDSEHMIEVVP